MDVIGANKAKQEFEELLAATWAAQLAQLQAQPGLNPSAASGEQSRAVQGDRNDRRKTQPWNSESCDGNRL